MSKLTSRIKPCVMSGVLALLLGPTTTANAGEIFRWVDKNGQVHYGDMLPSAAEGKNAQTKKLQDSVIEQDAVSYEVSTAMKNNPVTLYTNSCGESCTNARALLAKRGVPYTEKNPETDVAAAAVLKALVGAVQVPTVVIGTNNLSGYEQAGWNAALNAAGYPLTNPNLRPSAAKAGPATATPPPPPPVK